MGEQENMLLKVGSLLILIGGIASGLFGIIASAAALLAMNSLDESAMSGLDSYFQLASGGMFSGERRQPWWESSCLPRSPFRLS